MRDHRPAGGRTGLKLPGDPSPGQRARYALGGRLPEDRRDWVRHDLTDAGWQGRAVLRVVLQALAPALLLALLPGPSYVRWMGPLLVLVCAVFVGGAYGEDLRDRRLRQHALPVPTRRAPPRGF